jgi:hypothetical protein
MQFQSPVAPKLKTEDFRLAAILFYILQKYFLSESCFLYEGLLQHLNSDADIT